MNDSSDFLTVIKILYRNKLLILIIAVAAVICTLAYVMMKKDFKTTLNLYSNDRVLKEINEPPVFSLNSFEFYKYLKDNSKKLSVLNIDDDNFYSSISKKITLESDNNSPNVKIQFNTEVKNDGKEFAREFTDLANKYLYDKKNIYLSSQIKALDEQFLYLKQNIDLSQTKDPLIDSTISKLSYYRLLDKDKTPLLKLIDYQTKASKNKKLILVLSLFLGFAIGILAAFIKEFLKTINWKDIKENQ